MYEEFIIGITVINIVIGAINTYWAYKRTCYNRDVYHGSQQYWASWKDRSKDVSEKILKEIGTQDLEKELKKRYAREKQKKKSRRIGKGSNQSTTGTTK